jgi:4-carboxymuconolactone decarboxylase
VKYFPRDFRLGSKAPVRSSLGHFRSAPITGPSHSPLGLRLGRASNGGHSLAFSRRGGAVNSIRSRLAPNGLLPLASGKSHHEAVGNLVHTSEGVQLVLRFSAFGLLLAGSVFAVGPVTGQQRLPAIAPEQYTPEQKRAAEEFLAARKVPVFGPFEPMMHSPDIMSMARSMGDYLRYHSAIGNTLSELVILVTAREWSQDYEWYVHQPIALKAGITKDIADAIADGRRPAAMSTVVYDFTTELQRNKRVSDITFDRAEQRFGKKGVVDMAGITGYYTFLAMQLNMARYQFTGEPRLSRFPN